MAMPRLPSLLIFMLIIHHSYSARTLADIPPPPPHHHKPPPTTFFSMQNPLTKTKPFRKPPTTKDNHQLPFPKPVGFFPPTGGIPLPEPNPGAPAAGGLSTQTVLDLSDISLSFPAVATLQEELEFGTVLVIDEDLFEGRGAGFGPSFSVLGKAKGVSVANSEDGIRSHMVAMTTSFGGGDQFEDSLRFFGVLKTDIPESHIAVIGGTGKYDGANGYATVKALTAGKNGSAEGSEGASTKPLLFNVYLS